MKVSYKTIEPAYVARQRFQNQLSTEMFSIFTSNICCNELDGDTLNYILRRLYTKGSILATLAPESKVAKAYLGDKADLSGFLVFSDYAEEEFGYLDLPTKVRAINPRGVSFIPSGQLTPNVNCVIGHCCKNRLTPNDYVQAKIKDIVDIMMTIRTNLNALKQPFIVTTSARKVSNAQSFMNALLSDEPILFKDSKDSSTYNVTNLNVHNEIKDLYEQALRLKNEVLTFLGVDNQGLTFKEEHLNSDEVNSNNVVTNVYGNNFKSALKEFEDDIEETLGVKIHFYTIAEKSASIHEEINKENNDDSNEEESVGE